MVQHDVEDTRWKHCVYWAEFTVEYRTVGENILISKLIWVSRSNFTTNAPFTLQLRNVSKLFFFDMAYNCSFVEVAYIVVYRLQM